MMFTFSEEYIFKSMWDMVRDEGNRIVSLGLASHDDIKKFIGPAVQDAMKEASGNEVVLYALGKIHEGLRSVYLEGDFEKLAEPEEEMMQYMLEPTPEKPEEAALTIPGDEPEEADEEEEDEAADQEERDALSVPEEGVMSILSTLDNMVYKLGMAGDHDGAYKIERVIRNIERVAALLDKEDIKKLAAELEEAIPTEDEERPF